MNYKIFYNFKINLYRILKINMIILEKIIKNNPLLKKFLSQTLITTNNILKILDTENNYIDFSLQQKIWILKEELEWKRICVVGNSPILNKAWLGNEIDNYDAIFRCNLWILPNIWDPIDIWNRTTHFVTWLALTVSFNVKIYNILNQKSTIKSIAFTNSDKIIQTKIAKILLPNDTKFIYSYDQLFEEKNIWLYPSTWTRLLDLLINNIPFENLSIYGFSFSGDNRISGSSITNHQRDKEEAYILSLIENKNNITLIK